VGRRRQPRQEHARGGEEQDGGAAQHVPTLPRPTETSAVPSAQEAAQTAQRPRRYAAPRMLKISDLDQIWGAAGSIRSTGDEGHGIVTCTPPPTWENFPQVVRFLSDRGSPRFVYRAQRHSGWALESSIDRDFSGEKVRPEERGVLLARHLDHFQRATLGRRGPNPAQPISDDDWWALGQHNDLHTPLLDWTGSPYVAAFFAFEVAAEVDANDPKKQSPFRVVYALAEDVIDQRMEKVALQLLRLLEPTEPRNGGILRRFVQERPLVSSNTAILFMFLDPGSALRPPRGLRTSGSTPRPTPSRVSSRCWRTNSRVTHTDCTGSRSTLWISSIPP
jgi:hypothetical protein